MQRDVLAALVSGESAATWLFGESGDGAPLGGPPRAGSVVVTRQQGGDSTLSGKSTLVQDADVCAWILVTAAAARAHINDAAREQLGGRLDADGMAPALTYLNSRVMSIAGGTNEMQRNARHRDGQVG